MLRFSDGFFERSGPACQPFPGAFVVGERLAGGGQTGFQLELILWRKRGADALAQSGSGASKAQSASGLRLRGGGRGEAFQHARDSPLVR